MPTRSCSTSRRWVCVALARPGELTEDGCTSADGDLPVNVSGGSLGMGHLLDATGLARALEVVLQLRGEAGARQLEDVEVGLVPVLARRSHH